MAESSPEPPAVDPRLFSVMSGKLQDLPLLASKIVRIFTSSTFTDTTTERNALMEGVYPRLKEYCRERHGFEFQVVDMRWGVRDEATDDHMTTELCMKEIDNCQRLSVGPNFVVFLGQKYGYRPIPTIIPAAEFEMLQDVIKESKADHDILTTWYKRDDNSVPSQYVLQPISSILTNFNNKRHQALMQKAQDQWWEIMGKLQQMVRKAAQVLLMGRKMDKEQMHNYFMSVTEREVRRGIINAKNTADHVLAYVRQIDNINLTAIRFARNFVDMIGRDVDKEAERLLTTLRDEKLPHALPAKNHTKFTVEWSGREGIDRETHQEYLTTFCKHFYENIVRLVDEAVFANQKLSDARVYGEVLQQLHMCNKSVQMFEGRDNIISSIDRYIQADVRKPLVLWGESGCGKTSLLAKAYSKVRQLLPKKADPVMCLRFLGTSPDSSGIVPLLTSLSHQICFNYEQPIEEIPDELSPLIQYFKRIISVGTTERPLVIFLDSLDQLSGSEGAHQLAWLPVTLPPHVKFVVSTLPNYYGIFDTLKKLLPDDDDCFVKITPLGEDLGSIVLRSYLKNAERTVTPNQWSIIQDAMAKCNLPLYVKLVFDEVRKWQSYSLTRHTHLAFTINDSIHKLFDRVEQQHGKILVQHALGYLTAAKSGLSEAELEDLLSLDERVLNDVYQYHLPPVRRIPPLLWTRIRNDLPNYFSEREADGLNVINWYHRQFIEASRERYFRNVNFLKEMHGNMAEYFLGTWGGRPKPFEYSELQRQRFFLDDTKGESDRKVPEQPLYFTDVKGNITRYNQRKLSEMAYHLIRCENFDVLLKECIFNVRWLSAKVASFPLQVVLVDIEEYLEDHNDRDVKLLADALRLSASILSRCAAMVGPHIVGRLLPLYNSHIKIQELIQQCDSKDGLNINALVPAYHCLHTPGGPLQYSLEGHPFAPFGIAITSDAKYLVSVSNIFIIFDLKTGDVYRQVNPSIQGIMQNLCVSPDDKYAIAYTNNNQVLICSIMTGDITLLKKPIDGSDNIMGTSVSNTHLGIYTPKEWYLFTMDGTKVAKTTIEKDQGTIIHFELSDNSEEQYIVTKIEKGIPGVETDDDMTLVVCNGNSNATQEPFDFHSCIVISPDKSTLYACIAISDNAVACYKKEANQWKYNKTMGNNFDKIYSLNLSEGQRYLVGTVALGYKLWDLKLDRFVQLKLPTGTRNIPSKNQITSPVVFSRHSEFIVAGVRKNIYVWDTKVGNLVKTLDAHFGRVIALKSVIAEGVNKVISASMDKSVKVWNFDNILEDVHAISRHEKPIEGISLAKSYDLGATITRNCVGIWNLDNGRMLKTLANSAHSSIVTHAVFTGDGRHIISAESGNVLIWDMETEKVLKLDPQKDVQQLILTAEDARVIAFSKMGTSRGRCVCRTVPAGDQVYQFEFNLASYKNAVLNCDGTYLVVPALEKMENVLSVYHAKNGSKMYDMIPKYNDYVDYSHIIAMPHDPHLIALIDPDKGNIWDIKKKSLLRSVKRWNGVCTRNGKLGLYAPDRGGLELIELRRGETVHVMIPRVAEGVFEVTTMFTKNDKHVIYYHSGHRSVRLFRVADGRKIAEYRAHAQIKALAVSHNSTNLVLGAVDGSVVNLVIADPENPDSIEHIQSLASRQLISSPMGSPRKTGSGMANGSSIKFGAITHVARAAAKARMAQKSRACVIS